MRAVVLVVALATAVNAHMCLLAPFQRGWFNSSTIGKPNTEVNIPEDPRCALTTAPCGGAPAGPVSTSFRLLTSIAISKNRDHYYPRAPGNFTVNLWKGDAVTTLASWPDEYDALPWVYTTNVRFPAHPAEVSYVLQVVYYTNNPAAPAAFYQCADISLIP